MIVNKRIGKARFTKDPDEIMKARLKIFWFANPFGIFGSSSPRRRTNPPMKNRLREYNVFPFLKEKILGGKPIPSSCTGTFNHRAEKKCPNS